MAVSAFAYPVMRITSTSGWISFRGPQQVDAAVPRHDEIGQDHVEPDPVQLVDRIRSGPRLGDVPSLLAEDRGKEGDDHRFVVDDQDPLQGIRIMSRFPPADRPEDGGPARDEDERPGEATSRFRVAGSAHLFRGRAVLVRSRLAVVRRGGGWKGEEQAKGEQESGENSPRPRSGEDPTLAMRARMSHRMVYTTFLERFIEFNVLGLLQLQIATGLCRLDAFPASCTHPESPQQHCPPLDAMQPGRVIIRVYRRGGAGGYTIFRGVGKPVGVRVPHSALSQDSMGIRIRAGFPLFLERGPWVT